MSRQEQEPKEITITKGELPENELARIAWTQIASPNPQQIRIEEGMGYMIYHPDNIRKINRLPTAQKKQEAREIIDDMLCADFVRIERPTAPKPSQTQDL